MSPIMCEVLGDYGGGCLGYRNEEEGVATVRFIYDVE